MKIRNLFLLFLLNFSSVIFANDYGHLTVHYWSDKGSPFGHVAINVESSAKESVYISYVMGNDLQRDLAKLGPSETLTLPLKSEKAFQSYKVWWRNGPFWHNKSGYGKDYSIVHLNCVHAVAKALKFLGYETKYSDKRFARPKKLWEEVQNFIPDPDASL